jgi:hypothetical protein
MPSNIVSVVSAALEEAERNASARPWTLTMQPLNFEASLSQVVTALESSEAIEVHRNTQGNIQSAELKYRGLEVLQVCRDPTLRKNLEERLRTSPNSSSVGSVCKAAEDAFAEYLAED